MRNFTAACISGIDFAIMVMIIEYACTNESAIVYRAVWQSTKRENDFDSTRRSAINGIFGV